MSLLFSLAILWGFVTIINHFVGRHNAQRGEEMLYEMQQEREALAHLYVLCWKHCTDVAKEFINYFNEHYAPVCGRKIYWDPERSFRIRLLCDIETDEADEISEQLYGRDWEDEVRFRAMKEMIDRRLPIPIPSKQKNKYGEIELVHIWDPIDLDEACRSRYYSSQMSEIDTIIQPDRISSVTDPYLKSILPTHRDPDRWYKGVRKHRAE